MVPEKHRVGRREDMGTGRVFHSLPLPWDALVASRVVGWVTQI